jgi:nucleoside-diphosphate-sugar epimerase
MNRVLVTGASGFVGRHCLPLLVDQGYEVHGLCRDPDRCSISEVSWHRGDLLQAGYAGELMRQLRPQFLLHLAWYSVPGEFWEARENLDWLRASLELLSAFRENGGGRLVAAGTCAEYDWNAGECREDITPLLPATLYGMSKHALERIVHSYKAQSGLSSAWGRLFFLYGPYEHPSRLVAYVVQSLLKGEPAFCSDGLQVRDFMYVKDVASAFVSLLTSEVQGPVNIALGNPVSVREVLNEISQQTGRPDLLRLGARDSRPEPARIWADARRLKEEVGCCPRYDLAAGIRQTIEWWRQSLNRNRCLTSGMAGQ